MAAPKIMYVPPVIAILVNDFPQITPTLSLPLCYSTFFQEEYIQPYSAKPGTWRTFALMGGGGEKCNENTEKVFTSPADLSLEWRVCPLYLNVAGGSDKDSREFCSLPPSERTQPDMMPLDSTVVSPIAFIIMFGEG